MNIYLKTFKMLARNPLYPLFTEVEEWFKAIARFEKSLEDWSGAPEGAIYKTVTADGTVDYWDDEPSVKFDMWDSATGPFHNTMWQRKYGHIEIPLGYDWRMTKRKRQDLTL